MKPIIKLSVLLLVTFCSFGFARAQNSENSIARVQNFASSIPHVQSPNIKITIEIEIGHKPKPECPGFGVCWVKITGELKPASSGTAVLSDLAYSSDNSTIQWTVSRNELVSKNPSKLKYFENQRSVTFDDDVVLPSDVSQAMGIKGTAVIKAGTYSVSYSNGTYLVSLTNIATTATD